MSNYASAFFKLILGRCDKLWTGFLRMIIFIKLTFYLYLFLRVIGYFCFSKGYSFLFFNLLFFFQFCFFDIFIYFMFHKVYHKFFFLLKIFLIFFILVLVIFNWITWVWWWGITNFHFIVFFMFFLVFLSNFFYGTHYHINSIIFQWPFSYNFSIIT